MNEKMTCETCQESLPLLFAGTLTEKDEASIREHLEGCSECHALLNEEKALFALSRVDNDFSPLSDHPASDLLDRYVHAKPSLSPLELREIENHLPKCQLCNELVAELGKLPANLDGLMAGKQLPLIAGLEKKPRQKASIIDISRRIFWQPLAGYAAAAVILLTAVMLHQNPATQLIPTVSGVMQPSKRGTEQIPSFESPSQQCYLNLKYYVDPEAGHQYDIEIKPESPGVLAYIIRDYRGFDSKGFATVKALLEVGKYRFVVNDIEGNDTIRTENTFELKAR